MKMKTPGLLLGVAILYMLFLSIPVQAMGTSAGDVNGNGTVDVEDAVLLRSYLVGDPVAVYETGADYNQDNVIDLKDIVLLERQLGINAAEQPDLPSPTPIPQEEVSVQEIVYGKSERGRNLVCTVIEPTEYSRTVLLNFAIHGFEDCYDHDAQVLVDTAQLVIDRYSEADNLYGCRLIVVSCANPDGLLDGYTKDGFGRCNANGVDLNRDFDAAHKVYTSARNFTQYPFSAAESRALRDLVLACKPDVVLDCHGWENCTIGDSELAKVFYEEEGLVHRVSFSDNAHGYFSYWAHQQGALALLVEFTNPSFNKGAFLRATDRLVSGDYEHNGGIYTEDETFSRFVPFQAYTIAAGNVPVFLDIDGEQGGTIYGTEDLCVIEKVYQNGWVRVRYPIQAGYKEGYCRLDTFKVSTEEEMQKIIFSQNETVYRRQDLGEKLGTVYPTDESWLIAEVGNMRQILYPLDSGSWKMGWVSAEKGTIVENSLSTDPDIEISETDLKAEVRSSPEGNHSALLSGGNVRTDTTGIVEIPVLLQAEDLSALRLWIMMDTNVLELVSVENGGCLHGMTEAEDKSGSLCCVLWADSLQSQASASDGTLATARFAVKERANTEQTAVMFLVQTGDALTIDLETVSVSSLTVLVDAGGEGDNELSFPEELTEIGEEAFAGGAFRKVVLPVGMKTIRKRAFADCPNLKEVVIPASVTSIAPDAFSGVPGDMTIFGEEGSYAEYYAEKYGFSFLRKDDSEFD